MRRCAIAMALLGCVFTSASQQTYIGDALPKGYYIVVAAYRIGQEKYMINYSDTLNKSGRHSKYGYDLSRNFYYVYLDFYSDFDESIREMLSTRKQEGFDRAWVRIMKDDPQVKMEEEDSKSLVEEKQERQVVVPVAEERPLVSEKVVMEVEERKVEPVSTAETKIFLRLYNPTNNEVIDGEVEIIDAERATLLKKEKSNQMTSIPYPATKSGKVTLVGSSFGYRKVQHDLSLKSLKDSLPDYVEWDKDHYVINFDLSRLQKGDIETLYNVYFFNDATVMLPESKYELDKLLDMLKSNSKYRVKLHGHTNGNGQGKIIYMGPGKNFFELTPDVTTGFGSARELSHQRAITIKEWLIVNQISADRIETKGWGGSRMLHDRDSDKARRNVRVEVEVLSE